MAHLAVGQIWKTSDPRDKRFVKIVELVDKFTVRVQRTNDDMTDNNLGRISTCQAERFGRPWSRGYILVRDVEHAEA